MPIEKRYYSLLEGRTKGAWGVGGSKWRKPLFWGPGISLPLWSVGISPRYCSGQSDGITPWTCPQRSVNNHAWTIHLVWGEEVPIAKPGRGVPAVILPMGGRARPSRLI